MKVRKAVITAAARNQRSLPLQTLIDRDGNQKAVLNIIIDEAKRAGVEEVCVVVCPGDESAYQKVAAEHTINLRFIPQELPLGYGHAIFTARDFVGEEPFLHMVGDHVYVSGNNQGCAEQLVGVARTQTCSVSGVQPTRENLLPLFGAVGGQRVKSSQGLFLIEHVLEKPTPTEAEQLLMIAGLRTGHYLCFFGMHIFTPIVMELLEIYVRNQGGRGGIGLSPVLSQLAKRERYLALKAQGRRYPVDIRYGLLTAQLALALSGRDREFVLAGICELLAQRHLDLHASDEKSFDLPSN